MRSVVRTGVGLLFVVTACLLGAGPAAADASPLTVNATFDRSSYPAGEVVSVTIHVHNSGSLPATGVTARQDHGPDQILLQDGGLGALQHGATIAAGATLTTTVFGSPPTVTAARAVLSGVLYDGKGVAVGRFSATVAIVAPKLVPVRGLVYVDANANGHPDAGEGAAGVTVVLSHSFNDGDASDYSATTGPDGRFSVSVPSGPVALRGGGGGLEVIPQFLTVGRNGLDLVARAVRPLDHVLSADIHFDRSSYNPGDTAHVAITLTNSGPTALVGITGGCDLDRESLFDLPADLGVVGRGVNLQAHQTRVFHLSHVVPQSAATYGVVSLSCTFGYPGVYDDDRPLAGDSATVPAVATTPPSTRTPAAGNLSDTGATPLPLALIGGAALLTGLLLTVAPRRRTRELSSPLHIPVR